MYDTPDLSQKFAMTGRAAWAAVVTVLGIKNVISAPMREGFPVWLWDGYNGPLNEGWALPLAWLLWGSWTAYGGIMLVRRFRLWMWSELGLVSVPLLALTGPWYHPVGFALLHLLAFDPAWLEPRRTDQPELIFYDGHCGLCHRWVKFVLARDPAGRAFAFSPLQGETIKQKLSPDQREQLPDSLVLLRADGAVLTRSAGVNYMLDKLGGRSRLSAWLMRPIPRVLRDFGYDCVARVRKKVFGEPTDTCPILPPDLRQRFLP